jgi:hypothetical protein
MVVVNLKYVNCDVDSFDSFHTVTKLGFFLVFTGSYVCVLGKDI